MIYEGIEYEIDEELSFRDLAGRDMGDISKKIIYASCFSNETPDSDIFNGTVGATFIKCNLDNVFIPNGNTVIDCSQRRFKVQNDLNDWEIDENDNPIRPANVTEKFFIKNNLPIPKPEDIPARKVEERIKFDRLPEKTVQVVKDGVTYDIPVALLEAK